MGDTKAGAQANRFTAAEKTARTAAGLPLDPGGSAFNFKSPFKVTGSGAQDGNPTVTFEQGNQKFWATSASKKAAELSKGFDASKPFEFIQGIGGIKQIKQGDINFAVNIEGLTEPNDPTDPATLSPNAAAKTALPRVPRDVKGGSLLGTAAARARSNAAVNRSKRPDLLVPQLAGY